MGCTEAFCQFQPLQVVSDPMIRSAFTTFAAERTPQVYKKSIERCSARCCNRYCDGLTYRVRLVRWNLRVVFHRGDAARTELAVHDCLRANRAPEPKGR